MRVNRGQEFVIGGYRRYQRTSMRGCSATTKGDRPRLKAVLVGVAHGRQNSDIAEEVGSACAPVESHRKLLLMERLRLKTPASLALCASAQGLL
jgi:DNA-binding NarL/FixJ family response regulator